MTPIQKLNPTQKHIAIGVGFTIVLVVAITVTVKLLRPGPPFPSLRSFFLNNPWSSTMTFLDPDPILKEIGYNETALLTTTTDNSLLLPWDVQIMSKVSSDLSFEAQDVVLVEMWLKSSETYTTNAKTEFVIEMGSEPYAKVLAQSILSIPKEWTKFSIPFISQISTPASNTQFCFRMGYGLQAFQVAGLNVTNFGKSRRFEDFPSTLKPELYEGHEANATWRSEAQQRIQAHRMADIQILVKTIDNVLVPNASVKVEMQKHAFKFGTAVTAKALATGDPAGPYHKNLASLFNRVVFENDLKWGPWLQANQAPTVDFQRAYIDTSLAWLQSTGFDVRGHTLLWGAWSRLPNEIAALSWNPPMLSAAISQHISDISAILEPYIAEWDVVNEPTTSRDVFSLLGLQECVSWFRQAQAAAPRAKLYLNDFPNPSIPNLLPSAVTLMESLLASGAPLHGYGIQAHIGATPWSIPSFLADMASLSTKFPNLELQITEYDTIIMSEQLDATYLTDFMTAVFSIAAFTGFSMWGFWDGMHWQSKAPFFRLDWTEKPAVQAFRDLVFRDWWTTVEGATNELGNFSTRGFLGDYAVTVRVGGKEVKSVLKLDKPGAIVEIIIP
ncbi:hypothetical protein HDV05_004535 [Chytridiales sp. JEL 0842]|nr:hypothetical protein HDV05_004535 [Chytridiales sp. JEL 0842]